MSCETIRKFSTLTLMVNPLVLVPPTLITPAVKKIFAEKMSGNAWTNRTPWQVSRTGVNGTTLGNIGNAYVIRKTSSPDLLAIIGATSPSCDLSMSKEIENIRQSTSPDLRQSNKLDTSINWQFTNNLVVPPIFSEVLGENSPTAPDGISKRAAG